MDSDSKPPYTQFRAGRWFWEPPKRLRLMHGAKTRPLGADQAQAWALARRLTAELLDRPAGAPAPGTVAWIFDQFFATDKFKSLAHSTQVDYRWLAKRLGKLDAGGKPLAQLTAMSIKPRHADHIIDTIRAESGHSTSHYCARFARRVWKWAARKEFVGPVNPFKDMELKGLAERDVYWMPDQVAIGIAKAYEMDFASIGLAMHIAYGFAHRKTDILTLTWTALDSGLRKTSKTGVKLPMVQGAYPDMDAAIEAERERQKASPNPSTHVIQCELTGRPWHPDTFTHHFRDIMNAAGIPKELQYRDLRATASTEMADGGAEVIDMSTHTGHKTLTMARRYARRTAAQFQRAAATRQPKKDSAK